MYSRTPLAVIACCILACAAAAQGQVARGGGSPCNFYGPPSLLERFLDAEMTVVGRLQNAVEADNAAPDGQTEVVIDEVLKPHKLLKDRKVILIPRTIKGGEKYLIALETFGSKIDASFGAELDANGATLKYVRGAMQLKDKSKLARLRYNIEFLQDPCAEVAQSAHVEVGFGKYADIRKVGESLKPEPLTKALTSPDVMLAHRGTFAMLLAHCGRPADAVLVRRLIDDIGEQRSSSNELSSFLFAYVLLERKSGWDFLVNYSQQKGEQTFLKRYFALQAIRQLGAERKDLVTEKQWDDAMLALMRIADMSDFIVEDYRKLKRWQHCDSVLELFDAKGFEAPIIRRMVLRYALQCPAPNARAFVAAQRVRDHEWVENTEELLKLE